MIPHNNEQVLHDWNDIWKHIKRFILLVFITAGVIIVIGLAAGLKMNIQGKSESSASSLLVVDNKLLHTILADGLPLYSQTTQADQTYSASQLASIVMKALSKGGMNKEQILLMSSGTGIDPNIAPIDEHQYSTEPLSTEELDNMLSELQGETIPLDTETDSTGKNNGAGVIGSDHSDSEPVVFIYHTHNRESWNSELGENDQNASSKEKNITLVGKRLAEKLEGKGVGSMVSDADYPTTVPGYEWAYSYKYSRKTVKEAIASNDQLQFFFDLHRDSQSRKYTTAEIDGVSYAQVYFIIGQRNPNWKENEAFAKKIHEKLEKKYPGLSRGIWGKTAASGNAEYNQSLASQNVLIEVGGVDNTLDESYRTVDALAEVISELYKESQSNE